MRKYSLIVDEKEVNLNQIPEFTNDMSEFQNLVAFTGHFKNQDEMTDWLFKRHLIDTSLPLSVFIGTRSDKEKNGEFKDIDQPIIYKRDIVLFNPKVIISFFELNYHKPEFIRIVLGKFREYYYNIVRSRTKQKNDIEESYRQSLSEADRNTVILATGEYADTPIRKDIRKEIEAKESVIKKFSTAANSIDEIIYLARARRTRNQDLEYQRGLSFIINNIIYDENGKPKYRNIAKLASSISTVLDTRIDLSIIEPNYLLNNSSSIVDEDIDLMDDSFQDIFDLAEGNVDTEYYENLEADLTRALIENDLEYVYTLLEIVEQYFVKLYPNRTKIQELALTDINIIMSAIKFESKDGSFGGYNQNYENAKANLTGRREWIFVQYAIDEYYKEINKNNRKQK